MSEKERLTVAHDGGYAAGYAVTCKRRPAPPRPPRSHHWLTWALVAVIIGAFSLPGLPLSLILIAVL